MKKILYFAIGILLSAGSVYAQTSSYVQLPPNSTGVKLQGWTNSISSNTVMTQAFTPVGTNGAAIGIITSPIFFRFTDGAAAYDAAKAAQLPAALDGSGNLKTHEQGTASVQLNTPAADFDTTAGTQNIQLLGIALPGSGGAAIGGLVTSPFRIDPTGTTTQPVSQSKRTGTTLLAPNYAATHITTKTTTTTTAATAYISAIQICVTGAGTSWSLNIQNKEGTPKVLYTAASVSLGNTTISFAEPILATSGIDIVTAGTTAGVMDIFITYWQ